MRRQVLLASMVAVSVLASGCALMTPVNTHRYAIVGAFQEEGSRDALSEVEMLARTKAAAGGYVLESAPPSFRIHGMTSADCEALHEALREKPYLLRLDACRPDHLPPPEEETAQGA